MSFKIKKAKPKPKFVMSAMFRIPDTLQERFNLAMQDSNLSAQQLLEQMVEHCLKEIEQKGPADE